MTRALITINRDTDRVRACAWVNKAPWGTRVEFKPKKRSLEQNERMWAMLTDIATQLRYHGLKLSTNDWKLIFLDALDRENRIVPNLDGNGIVSLTRSSSDLSVQEMSDLMELMAAYGARHGVVFGDEAKAERVAA